MGHDESHLISWHVGLHVELTCFIGMLMWYYYVNMALHVRLGGE